MKRWLLTGLLLIGIIFLGLVAYAVAINEDRPVAAASAEADALAHKMEAAVNVKAWREIPAISWVFAGRHTLLWDKQRDFVRVAWGDNVVVRSVGKAEGIATVSGTPVDGEAKTKLLDEAYAYWANDSFWLNPIAKLFDPGVTRALAKNDEGEPGLLVSYSSGGVTPGDAYLWHLDDKNVPTRWQMWVDIIPIGGVNVTWDAWVEVAGAQISTGHKMGLLSIEITEVAAGALAEIAPGPDPFAALAPSALPASQPTR